MNKILNQNIYRWIKTKTDRKMRMYEATKTEDLWS